MSSLTVNVINFQCHWPAAWQICGPKLFSSTHVFVNFVFQSQMLIRWYSICSDCLAHDRWWDAVFLCLPCPRWRGVVVAERLFDLYLFNLSTPRALPISAWEEGRTEVGLAELASWSNNTCCRCSITVLNIKSLPTITTCFFFPYSILSFANTPQNTNSQWHI